MEAVRSRLLSLSRGITSWRSLMCVGKGYETLRPYIERIVAGTDAGVHPRHLEATEAFLTASRDYQDTMERLLPMSTMSSAERLKRVANICGLEMPKMPISQ